MLFFFLIKLLNLLINVIIWKQNIDLKGGIWTNMICKTKYDGNLEIWKKDQGSTYVVITIGVMTAWLGGGRQLQVVTGKQS